mmetsp:Transcript_23617/g.30866  ORF Transcript_23617/g.30866 Transcript_23617/m.30866 type:complete len:86 (+) Transcript_23617:433-690(+)
MCSAVAKVMWLQMQCCLILMKNPWILLGRLYFILHMLSLLKGSQQKESQCTLQHFATLHPLKEDDDLKSNHYFRPASCSIVAVSR